MNLNATQFDLVNARACAAASADAYRECSVSDAATDTRCLVREFTDCSVIAFRGTAGIRNWITDANFERELLAAEPNGDECRVHAGFLAAFDGIIGPLTDYLKKAGGAGARPVFVTGHSLGGALAILAALELTRRGFEIAQVYTFGQPRVGNGAFKRLYECSGASATAAIQSGQSAALTETPLHEKTFRLVYQEDIVPRLPHLPAWHDPYRHVGTEIFIPSFDSAPGIPNSAFWIDPPWWRRLLSDAWGIYRAFIVSRFRGALDPLVDHQMANYIVALANVPTAAAGGPRTAAGPRRAPGTGEAQGLPIEQSIHS